MRTVLGHIKGYFKTLTIRGIVNWVVFIIMGIALLKACRDNGRQKDIIDSFNSSVIGPKITPAIREAEEIARKVDTAGRERVVYKMSDPIIKKIEDKTKLDSIARIAGQRADKIKAYDEIRASMQAENLELKRIIKEGLKDTSKWEYRDKWLVNTIYKIDTSYKSDVWIDASVNRVEHDHKKLWFLGRNESRSTIWFNSPYIKPDGYSYYRVDQKEPFVDLNLLIEGKYMHSQKELLIGPKIKLELGRFGVSGGYYINPGGSIGNGVWYGADWKVY